jgi:hypothetical protein
MPTNRTPSSLVRPAAFLIALAAAAAACQGVPIDPNDGSKPTVTLKVKGADGQWTEQTAVTHSNSTAQDPIEILCVVEDPQGVKSIDLRVSDDTVTAAYCGGTAVSPGSYQVDDLPEPLSDTLTGSSGRVPTKLAAILTIPGILALKTIPIGQTGPCYPANGTYITVRGRGGNWSSDPAQSSATDTLQVNFKY